MLTARGSTVLTARASLVGAADAGHASSTADARCGLLHLANQALEHLV